MPVTAPTPAAALPPAPSSTNPTTFAPLADPWVAAMGPFGTQMNALASNVFSNATDAATSATTASASSAAATAATGVVAWISGTTYAVGDNRFSPIDFQTYRRKTAGGGTTDPSLDTTNWQIIPIVPTYVKFASAQFFNQFYGM